jgi:hypothetical protein
VQFGYVGIRHRVVHVGGGFRLRIGISHVGLLLFGRRLIAGSPIAGNDGRQIFGFRFFAYQCSVEVPESSGGDPCCCRNSSRFRM